MRQLLFNIYDLMMNIKFLFKFNFQVNQMNSNLKFLTQ